MTGSYLFELNRMISPKHILIADDDRELIRALAIRLNRLGIQIRVAHDVETALGKIRQSTPNLIILDVNLFTGNGSNCIEMIVNDPSASDVPLIMLTSRKEQINGRGYHDLLARYVLKAPDIWEQVEPAIYQFMNLDPPCTICG